MFELIICGYNHSSNIYEYCRMANFSVQQFSLIFHFWVFLFLIFGREDTFFFVSNFPVLCKFLILVYQRVNINW